eukprot:scaffold249325_cov30-Tisochrysis_lutea.AAC.3
MRQRGGAERAAALVRRLVCLDCAKGCWAQHRRQPRRRLRHRCQCPRHEAQESPTAARESAPALWRRDGATRRRAGRATRGARQSPSWECWAATPRPSARAARLPWACHRCCHTTRRAALRPTLRGAPRSRPSRRVLRPADRVASVAVARARHLPTRIPTDQSCVPPWPAHAPTFGRHVRASWRSSACPHCASAAMAGEHWRPPSSSRSAHLRAKAEPHSADPP